MLCGPDVVMMPVASNSSAAEAALVLRQCDEPCASALSQKSSPDERAGSPNSTKNGKAGLDGLWQQQQQLLETHGPGADGSAQAAGRSNGETSSSSGLRAEPSKLRKRNDPEGRQLESAGGEGSSKASEPNVLSELIRESSMRSDRGAGAALSSGARELEGEPSPKGSTIHSRRANREVSLPYLESEASSSIDNDAARAENQSCCDQWGYPRNNPRATCQCKPFSHALMAATI